MPIDPLKQKAGIPADLERAKTAYPELWKRITLEWRASASGDFAWLTYSANYLFSTAGLKWALDPFSLSTRVAGIPQPDFAADLKGLSLVVLSHAHNDHLDLNLVKAVSHLPITWVIPGFMQESILAVINLPREHILTPVNGIPIHFQGLTLTPFDALHLNGKHGIPETGYLAEFNGLRWLFPGDTRNYDRSLLPDFGELDGVFAHLWLGKARALETPPQLLDEFCHFFGGFNARRLVITHLYEYGRDERDLWDETLCQTARERISFLYPKVETKGKITGQRVNLLKKQ